MLSFGCEIDTARFADDHGSTFGRSRPHRTRQGKLRHPVVKAKYRTAVIGNQSEAEVYEAPGQPARTRDSLK